MKKAFLENINNVVATIQTALGVALFVAPWVLGFADLSAAAWTAWGTGAVIAVLGLVNFAEETVWPAWGNLAVGAWAVAAPWVVQFASDAAAMWTHVVVGLIVAASSIWELYTDQRWTHRVSA